IKIPLNSLFQWVIQNNQPKVVTLLDKDSDNLSFEMHPDAQSKVALPISIGVDVFGIIDIQSDQTDIFPQASTQVLQTLANQLASAIQNFRLREGTQVDLQQVNQLYQASQRVTQAPSDNEIFNAAVSGVQQTTYFSAVYRSVGSELRIVQPDGNKPYYADQLPGVVPISAEMAGMYFEEDTPLILRNLIKPAVSIRPELLEPALAINAQEAAFLPIFVSGQLEGFIILASRDLGKISLNALNPFLSFISLIRTAIEKVQALHNTQKTLDSLKILTTFSNQIINETQPERLYAVIHEQIEEVMGNVDFYVALYDPQTNQIEIPYLYEGDTALQIEPFPLGEGLTSIVVRTRQPLMLVENTEERAKALGARIVGEPAKSWMGVPLSVSDEVIGIISLQDVEQEHRFTEEDLNLLLTLSPPIAGAIQSTRLLAESQNRAYQLETSAEISRETSSTLDREELLSHTIQLIQDRFNFYHASIFLLDPAGEHAVVVESTGEAGRKMKTEGHKLAVGSRSIIGYVTANKQPLVVNDVTQDPTHRFNPLLPDTRAELGIPILLGEKVIGALDVQSTTPYSFSPDDVEVLQILANQLAVAINNANLFMATQEHLAQHRLIHHVTTVSASSTSIDDALSSAVQGLRVILGDNISILLLEKKTNTLRIRAAAGYENDVIGMQIEVGQGITGWVAKHSEPLIVSDVLSDPRYIQGKESVCSEIAVPLVYRGELLGVLNVESDVANAYDEHDQDILGTLAGSLAAIIVNARLSERQQKLFQITNKIRQSVNIDTILETTATELTKVLQARHTRIEVGGDRVSFLKAEDDNQKAPDSSNGQEGE
ncbi:MAG: GAF domain-containing protein, partial [Anaerolineales bacterium]